MAAKKKEQASPRDLLKNLYLMWIEVTFIVELLGTKSQNEDLYREYLAGKHPEGVQDDEMAARPKPEDVVKALAESGAEEDADPDAPEIPSIEEDMIKGTTAFARNPDGLPSVFDYQVKGFCKDAQSMFNRMKGGKMPAYKKVVDGLIFPEPRLIPLVLPKAGKITLCTRPLRAQTPQGERVSLARSEEAPVGTTMSFAVRFMDKDYVDWFRAWLDYGFHRGFGQWRNSGKGRFTWRELEKAEAEARGLPIV